MGDGGRETVDERRGASDLVLGLNFEFAFEFNLEIGLAFEFFQIPHFS